MMMTIILFLEVYYLPGSVLSLMHMTTLCHIRCKHPSFIREEMKQGSVTCPE